MGPIGLSDAQLLTRSAQRRAANHGEQMASELAREHTGSSSAPRRDLSNIAKNGRHVQPLVEARLLNSLRLLLKRDSVDGVQPGRGARIG